MTSYPATTPEFFVDDQSAEIQFLFAGPLFGCLFLKVFVSALFKGLRFLVELVQVDFGTFIQVQEDAPGLIRSRLSFFLSQQCGPFSLNQLSIVK